VEVYGHLSAGVDREGSRMGGLEAEGTLEGWAGHYDVNQGRSQ